MSGSELPRPRKKTRKWFWLPLLLVVIGAGAAWMFLRTAEQANITAAPADPAGPVGVGARGRIEPEDGVMLVAAPYYSGRPSIIRELRVKEGDKVRAGQLLGTLDSSVALEKALRQREADVEVARTRLNQVKAGAKTADLDALRMEIFRWESEQEMARTDLQRYERLYQNEIASIVALDERRLAVERTKRTLDAAKERLKSLEEVRKEDIDVREAELAVTIAQVEHARAELERMIVRAPADGHVIRIHAYPGEEVGSQGILELAKTDRMYVIAEVYETDIHRVRVGQTAEITGELLTAPLTGTITRIDGQVTRSELLPIDTAAFADTRVVRVKIQLDKAEQVAGLIYGKVDVVIRP